ncbi:MAG: 1,4-dihydroxy-2-naphthoate octaprenyltransferase [Muribaculaceae bacterium]|nr:1,4-dihydroxy-2-naphthoate octaprenyltransferase [Muribaculaceae bacterium]
MKIKPWIEAVRMRTLPVSIAGVAIGAACAASSVYVRIIPAILCLLFAILAQTASNFANEYYDYAKGFDRPGREGPRRGVTEGDISPQAMKSATYMTLAMACAIGCTLVLWGGWWLIPVGIFIALGVTAYSTGPYPLSHHALGEVAVVVFYGIVPVVMTCYLMTGDFIPASFAAGLGTGLMGANVLIVNNYRDRHDDAAVGKHTLAVLCGPSAILWLYLINGLAAAVLLAPLWLHNYTSGGITATSVYLILHVMLWSLIRKKQGSALNPMLGATAALMSAFAISLLLIISLSR